MVQRSPVMPDVIGEFDDDPAVVAGPFHADSRGPFAGHPARADLAAEVVGCPGYCPVDIFDRDPAVIAAGRLCREFQIIIFTGALYNHPGDIGVAPGASRGGRTPG